MDISITPYVITLTTSFIYLLIAIGIALLIPYEVALRPSDPLKRRIVFWVFAAITPATGFLLGYFVFKPELNIMLVNKYVQALSIGTGVSFVFFLLTGFILSKIFKNGKLGHWF
jgi:sulfoxide reductase heme-binding subunit YedZ